LVLAAGVVALLLASCDQFGTSAAALKSYLAAVEPIRRGVNRLLTDADPVLAGYRDGRLSGRQAADAMGRLEQSFAAYTIEINALQPADITLARINAPYAHTYVVEDSYLNAVVAALPDGDFSGLPNTQSDQRTAIIQWRIQLEVLAQALDMILPADLQQAGRGEIAPSVSRTG
jgi:hypothetical protein